ncbi:hypothetical protein LO80_04650 [Candidatus Francisella endociliophora]|uniref:Uncharacterized protein n=1 Tax=Candidatus Francisella endociliophora TaxID=653937 RepID=A0A097EP30_9GAMM|nr:hypothetical protein LO80_04650 [Francisella sp. FSC1006]
MPLITKVINVNILTLSEIRAANISRESLNGKKSKSIAAPKLIKTIYSIQVQKLVHKDKLKFVVQILLQ